MKKAEQKEEKDTQQEEQQEEFYDYLVDYYENPQLLDMTANEEDAADYIVDLEHKDGSIVVTYLDGHQTVDEHYNEHNMNFWRRRVIDQINEYYDLYQDGGGQALLKILKSEIGSLLIPVAGGIVISLVSKLFLQYNIDIHIAIKIILEASLILKAAYDTFYNHYMTSRIVKMLMESNRYKKYADLSRDLEYYNKETNEYSFAVPVEDVWKKNLQEKQLEEIRDQVVRFKQELGDELLDLSLEYKPNEGPKL
jgi:hypothetical protein